MPSEKRILLGGFAHESNTFTPRPTQRNDFWICDDDAEFTRLWNQAEEYRGALLELQKLGYVVSPVIAGGATVGGTINVDVFEEYVERLTRRISSIDLRTVVGIQWVMHGSSKVKGIRDVQTAIIQMLKTVCPDVPIVTSFDLHSSITWDLVRETSAAVHYRTAPHRDMVETGTRASQLLHRTIEAKTPWDKVLIKLPLLLPGEFGQTDRGVMSDIYEAMQTFQDTSGAVDVSFSQGFPWADNPAGVVGLLGYWNQGEAARHLEKFKTLARSIWAKRCLIYDSVPLYSVDHVHSFEELTVFCDAGDNPTAGGAEDRIDVLAYVLEHEVGGVLFFPIVDPEVARVTSRDDVGSEQVVVLGGKLGGTRNISIQVTVAARGHHEKMGSWAILVTQGNTIVVTEKRFGVSTPVLLQEIGLDVRNLPRVLIVKSGYLFPAWTPWLKQRNGREKLLSTLGSTTLDLSTLPYHHMPTVTFPISKSTMMEPTMEFWYSSSDMVRIGTTVLPTKEVED